MCPATAGILRDVGYGLGVVVSDLNADGWPDIYVSNDGAPNDVLYVEQRGWNVHEQGRPLAQARQLCRYGCRHRRFQQRRMAGHSPGGHEPQGAQSPQTHERLHDRRRVS